MRQTLPDLLVSLKLAPKVTKDKPRVSLEDIPPLQIAAECKESKDGPRVRFAPGKVK